MIIRVLLRASCVPKDNRRDRREGGENLITMHERGK